MQDKAVIERFGKAGSRVAYLDGPEFVQFLEVDTDRLLKVVRKIGLSQVRSIGVGPATAASAVVPRLGPGYLLTFAAS
jgi:hypothetical protein